MQPNKPSTSTAPNILGLVGDVIIKIALVHPEVFRLLASTHPKFARILRRPDVQALAKTTFSRQHTYVLRCAPYLAIVAHVLPNGWKHLVQHVDDNGLMISAEFVKDHRHGVERRYTNGVLYRETNYHKGNRRGLEITYDSNGAIIQRIVWNDNDTMKSRETNHNDGTSTKERYVNGHLRERVQMVHDKIKSIERYRKEDAIAASQGWSHRRRQNEREPSRKKLNPATYKSYHLNQPKSRSDRSYDVEDLKLHGKQVTFHPNGIPDTIKVYQDGKQHGAQSEYDSDGKMTKYAEYALGYPHGRHITYHDNGKPAIVMQYERNCLSGESREYYENGVLKVVRTYDEYGRLNGPCTEYATDGSRMVVSEYKLNRLNGKRTEYSPDGTVLARAEYREGHIYSREELDRELGLVTLKYYTVNIEGDSYVCEQHVLGRNTL